MQLQLLNQTEIVQRRLAADLRVRQEHLCGVADEEGVVQASQLSSLDLREQVMGHLLLVEHLGSARDGT